MSNFKYYQNKNFLILPILLIISFFGSIYFGEDSLGGAQHDFIHHQKYFYLFSENFYETYKNFGLDFSVRNSPVFYMFFSIFLKLGLTLESLKLINLLILIPLSIFFIKCLNIKFPNINTESKIYFLSALFLSPTIRSLIAWPYPFLWALCFFLVSLYFYLCFKKTDNYKKKLNFAYLNILFLTIGAYITPNFAIFSLYFFYNFFKFFRFNKEIFYIICFNIILSIPAFYFLATRDFYLFQNDVYFIENLVKYNLSSKIIVITSIILIFFIPFITKENFLNRIKSFFVLDKRFFLLLSFILLNIYFYNFLDNAGGGIFYHFSKMILGNSFILFLAFAFSLYLFNHLNLYNINNIIIFIILVIYNLQFTIYYKYFDPLVYFLLLFLVVHKKAFFGNLNKLSKKYFIFYIFFLFLNLIKKNINY